MKKCTSCKVEKELTEFNIQREGTPDGHTYKCKSCATAATKAWTLKNRERVRSNEARRYAANPQPKKDSAKKYRDANLSKCKAANKVWRENNKEKVLSRFLKYTYGLSIESYERMFKDQNGGCKICGKQNYDGKRLFVDHDHNTGTVRGLLCHHCNAGMGHFSDDYSLLESAIQYLKNHKESV